MFPNYENYAGRSGVYPVSWEIFHGLCKGLAMAVAEFQPEIILPVGRGGYYPGTLLAHMLVVEPYPVRVSRRVNDVVIYDEPVWLVEPPPIVQQRRVLIVDEICDAGHTLTLVKRKVESLGASAVKTAVLYAHTRGADIPDYVGLVSDALLLNPWDREIYREGRFQMHPEYAGALALQGLSPDPSLLIDAPTIQPARQ